MDGRRERAYIVRGPLMKEGRFHKEGAYMGGGGGVLKGNTLSIVLEGQRPTRMLF